MHNHTEDKTENICCGYTKKEIAEKAAHWWASQLGQTDADAGDESVSAISREYREEAALDVNEKNRQQFQKVLELLILVSKPVIVSVDYDPDEILSLSLSKARILCCEALPIKSVTRIDWNTGEISARLGRGGEWICVQNPRT